MLAQAAIELVVGRLFDIVEPRSIMLFSALIYIAGSVVCATAQSFWVIIVGQVLCGLSRACIVIGAAMILAITENDPRKKAVYIAVVSGFYGVMIKIAPIVGGGLLAIDSPDAWRWVFIVVIPFQAVFAAGIYAFPRLRRKRGCLGDLREFDIIGGALATSWVVCLIVPLLVGQIQGTKSWTDPQQITGFALTPFLLGASFWWERRKAESERFFPLRYMRRDRSIFIFLFIAASTSFIIACSIFYMPLYLQTVHQDTPIIAALELTPVFVLGAIASVVGSAYIFRWGPNTPRMWTMVGGVMGSVSFAAFWAAKYDDPLIPFFLSTCIGGFGISLPFAMGLVIITEIVPPARLGSAAAMMQTATAVGGVLGITLEGILITSAHERFFKQAEAVVNQLLQDDNFSKEYDLGALTNGVHLDLGHGIGWRPTQDADFRSSQHDAHRQAYMMYAVVSLLMAIAAIFLKPHVSYTDRLIVSNPIAAETRRRALSSSRPPANDSENQTEKSYSPKEIQRRKSERAVAPGFDARRMSNGGIVWNNSKHTAKEQEKAPSTDTERMDLSRSAPQVTYLPDSRPTTVYSHLSLNRSPRNSLQSELARPPISNVPPPQRSPLRRTFDSIRKRSELSRTVRERRLSERANLQDAHDRWQADLELPQIITVGRGLRPAEIIITRTSPQGPLPPPPIMQLTEGGGMRPYIDFHSQALAQSVSVDDTVSPRTTAAAPAAMPRAPIAAHGDQIKATTQHLQRVRTQPKSLAASKHTAAAPAHQLPPLLQSTSDLNSGPSQPPRASASTSASTSANPYAAHMQTAGDAATVDLGPALSRADSTTSIGRSISSYATAADTFDLSHCVGSRASIGMQLASAGAAGDADAEGDLDGEDEDEMPTPTIVSPCRPTSTELHHANTAGAREDGLRATGGISYPRIYP